MRDLELERVKYLDLNKQREKKKKANTVHIANFMSETISATLNMQKHP